ncbi:AAA family ATPase [Bacillaceae bacterium Marseille-Q3522]|nr:AAA family ATPase [Bacillaceae bacterium Marseille-Q3522]
MGYDREKQFLLDRIFDKTSNSPYTHVELEKLRFDSWTSEWKTDQFTGKYPKIKKFSYIIKGFFAIPKVFKIIAIIPVLLTLVYIYMNHFSIVSIFTLLYLFLVYVLLCAGVGGVINGIRKIKSFLSKDSEIEIYKRKLVQLTNRSMDLCEEKNSIFTGYMLSYINSNFDWLIINFYLNAKLDNNFLFLYLQTYLNTRIYQFQNNEGDISFRVEILGKDLNSLEEREKQLVLFKKQLDKNKQVNPYFSENIRSDQKDDSKNEMEQYGKEDDTISNKTLLDECLTELEQMIGLNPVKEKVKELSDMILLEKERNKIGQSTFNQSLHMIFAGNPGTGKTTVARIVAKILKALGVISQGHLVEVTRQDLVGEYIGHTAPKTRNIIEKAIGGVLFIDEAYSLSRGGENDFGKEAIDELVRGMEEHRSDLVVILAGYTKEMAEFLKTNSGLKSRIPNMIHFPDYSTEELFQIATQQLKQQQFILKENANKALLSQLERTRVVGRNDNGNGRVVRNIIEEAIRKQSKRLKQNGYKEIDELRFLLPEDFGEWKETKPFDLEAEFSTIIGNEEIKNYIRSLAAQLKIQKMRKERGLTSKAGYSLHMVFKGNPGTGKTTFARLISRLLKEMGVLKKGQLVETDRSGLVAQYVGQTAIKVDEVVKDALGGVLFIDEAYSLAPESKSDFGYEAIDTLVKKMEDYRENLVVILAGYNEEMDRFFMANTGLKSRFPHVFYFKDYTAQEMYEILKQIVEKDKYILADGCEQVIKSIFEKEIQSGNSGNGRFVRNLFENAVRNQSLSLQEKKNLDDRDLILLRPEHFADFASTTSQRE